MGCLHGRISRQLLRWLLQPLLRRRQLGPHPPCNKALRPRLLYEHHLQLLEGLPLRLGRGDLPQKRDQSQQSRKMSCRALNRNLPRGRDPYDSALQKIMDEHGLNRDQVRRQLSNYKKEFKHSGVKLTLSPEDIKESVNLQYSL